MTNRGYMALTGFAENYHKEGLEVLAFPCNQFGKEEPKSEADIKEFVQKKFGIPSGLNMMCKIDVNGPNTHPVYQHLKKAFPGDISWNFMGHFLVGRDGSVKERFGQTTSFSSVESSIKEALKESTSSNKKKDDKAA
ncbi:hypothetical protein AAMO2058_000383500 [Amorphochlora amoebiformis]